MNKIFRVAIFLALILCGIAYLIRMPSFTISIEDQSAAFVSASSLESHVKILSEDLVPRTCTKPENLHNASAYIKKEFDRWNSNTSFQHYQYGDDSFANVISEFGPDTDEVFIIGAHYDAFMPLPGADDNASGVAGLFELNRLFSEASLSKRIVLVAYSCEEPPHYASDGMGSVVHARSLVDKKVELMISLEMIGYFSDEENSQEFPVSAMSLLYPTTGDYIAVIGNMFTLEASQLKATINHVTDLDAYSINAPKSIPGIDFSDHRSYWALGYPAVMVSDTAFYRNMHYHEPTDTYEKLDYEKMAKVVYGVYVHVLNLAN